MTTTAFQGPLIAFGQAAFADYNPNLGTSLFFAGGGILDPRPAFTYQPGERLGDFTVGWLGETGITTLNAVPYTAASAALVASANPTGPSLTLVSANSATTGVSITNAVTNSATGQLVSGNLVALDSFASVTGTIAGNVLTITANTGMPIGPGMTILTAAGAGTLPTNTVIWQTLSGNGYATSTFLLSQPATIASGTITLAYTNPFGAALSYGSVNAPLIWSPMGLLGRALSYTAASGATYTTALATGYDIYGFPMSEQVTLTAGSTVNGLKAFKYVASVTLSGGTADTTHAYSVGTADVFGLPIRSDTFGDVLVNYAASLTATTLITAATSYIAAVTAASSSTTGDVRGTYAATSSTGANRLLVRQTPPAYNVGSIVGLYGNTQS